MPAQRLKETMVKRIILFALILFSADMASAQFGSQTAKRLFKGTTLPIACTEGDVFYKTTATAGPQYCSVTGNPGTWVAWGGGGGGGLPQGGVGAVQLEATSSTLGGDNTKFCENLTALVPGTPTISQPGTAGAATYTYGVTVRSCVGESVTVNVTTMTSQDPPTMGNPNVIHAPCGSNPSGSTATVYLLTAGAMGVAGFINQGPCDADYTDATGMGFSFLTPPPVNQTVGMFANGITILDSAPNNNVVLQSTGGWISGQNVVGIGTSPLENNTGNDVIAIGDIAGGGQTGSNVIAIGNQTADGNSGSDVIALGNLAVNAGGNNTGSKLVAIGLQASRGHTAGDDDIFIGSGNASFFPGTQKSLALSIILGSSDVTKINNSGGTPLTNIIAIGGTATDSNQTVIGNSGTILSQLFGGLGLNKMATSAVAPGAGLANMRWVAGTNSGTCKLVSNAGTSATEVTIIDNIGSGC